MNLALFKGWNAVAIIAMGFLAYAVFCVTTQKAAPTPATAN